MVQYLVFVALLVAVPNVAQAADFVFIKNAKNKTDKVSKDEARDMFTGKMKQWKKDGVVQLVLGIAGSPELKWLAETLFDVPDKTLLMKIKQEVFKGEMRKPINAASEQECVDQVKNNEGGLGVVSAAIAKQLPAEVKVVNLQD